MREMTKIIKFGGTLITNKNSNIKEVKQDVLDFLCREISYVRNVKLILVHGGGSYGHPLALKYNVRYGASYRQPARKEAKLLSRSNKEVKKAFWEISSSMKELNSHVVNCLRKYGMNAVPIHPHQFCSSNKGKTDKMPLEIIVRLVKQGFKPVLHGDVVLDSEWGLAILSGDQILMRLAIEKELNVDRIFLLTDVNGIYDKDPNVYSNAQKYEVVTPKMYRELEFKGKKFDVTGGMREKVNLCLGLAGKYGIVSEILNPFGKEGTLRDVIQGKAEGYGTIVKGDRLF